MTISFAFRPIAGKTCAYNDFLSLATGQVNGRHRIPVISSAAALDH
jgi:hypothetical protein